MTLLNLEADPNLARRRSLYPRIRTMDDRMHRILELQHASSWRGVPSLLWLFTLVFGLIWPVLAFISEHPGGVWLAGFDVLAVMVSWGFWIVSRQQNKERQRRQERVLRVEYKTLSKIRAGSSPEIREMPELREILNQAATHLGIVENRGDLG